jgi:hypothetical protein
MESKNKKAKIPLSDKLIKEWHPTKNGFLKSSDVTAGSGKKVWWLCPVKTECGCAHEYEAAVYSRSAGSDCPFCCETPRQVCYHNSIAFKNPELTKQWHPTKNKELRPEQFSIYSNTKVWWLCQIKTECECKHEWQTTINHRASGTSCPYCKNPPQKICIHKSLEFLKPEIAAQWHPIKNKDVKPDQFSLYSNTKVWWLCQIKTECECKHEWQTTINSRSSGNGCPFCTGRVICEHKSLEYLKPEFAFQWHPTKNGELTPKQFSLYSNVRVWWLCPNIFECGCLHEWEVSINGRVSDNTGCPYCSRPPKQICLHQSLLYKSPDLVKQWHPTKNKDVNPAQVFSNGAQKIWWVCSKNSNHEWKTSINNRTTGTNCPFCKHSKMELQMENLLQLLNLNFEKQKRLLPTLLRSDFYVSDLIFIIEMDGIQHFEGVTFGSSSKTREECLIEVRDRDKRKEEWCLENEVHLLRIDYLVDENKYESVVKLFIEEIKKSPITIIKKIGECYNQLVVIEGIENE